MRSSRRRSSSYKIDDAPERIEQIALGLEVLGLQVLTHSPLIGRKLRAGLRELAIGKAARGYVALYRYVPTLDAVCVLEIRGQGELGYRPEA